MGIVISRFRNDTNGPQKLAITRRAGPDIQVTNQVIERKRLSWVGGVQPGLVGEESNEWQQRSKVAMFAVLCRLPYSSETVMSPKLQTAAAILPYSLASKCTIQTEHTYNEIEVTMEVEAYQQ